MRALYDRLHELLLSLLHWVEGFAVTPYGHWALFAFAFAESSFFPVPPDVLLIALCLGDPSRSLYFALICSIGSVLGGILGYGIGYFGGRPVLYRFFDEAKINAVERYYDRFNAWATAIGALTPIPYKIFTLTGGALGAGFRIFVVASVLARSLRFFVVAGLMWAYGEPIKAFIEKYLNVLSIAFVVLLLGGYWLVAHRIGKVSADAEPSEEPPANHA